MGHSSQQHRFGVVAANRLSRADQETYRARLERESQLENNQAKELIDSNRLTREARSLCSFRSRSFYDHSTERFQVVYRLGHEVIKIGFEGALPVILACMSGECDGRYLGIN